jgi:hypothetical protein
MERSRTAASCRAYSSYDCLRATHREAHIRSIRYCHGLLADARQRLQEPTTSTSVVTANAPYSERHRGSSLLLEGVLAFQADRRETISRRAPYHWGRRDHAERVTMLLMRQDILEHVSISTFVATIHIDDREPYD